MLKTKTKNHDLRQGKEWKVLLYFCMPIVFSYILQQVYTISDAAIVGQTLSSDEVAGVNDVGSLVFIFLQFAFGCTAGFTVVTSRRFGIADSEGVRKSFATQIILCVIITVVLTVVSILSLNGMLAWINVTPDNAGVYRAAYDYCFVIFLGIFAQMFYNFICSFLRSIGDSFTPLIFLVISTIVNIALDLLFIIVFQWGVIGAAAATVVAQGLSTVACFVYAFIRYKELRLKWKHFKMSVKEAFEHLIQGLPMGLQFSVLAIGIIVMQGELIRFDLLPSGVMVEGNPAQNGYGAACKLGQFLMAPLNALGAGIVSFTAQNYGAGKIDRVKKGTYQGILIGLVMYVILAGLGLLLTIGGAYQYLFLSGDKVSEASITYGNIYLQVALTCYFILMILFVFRSAVQGIGKSGYTLLAGIGELIGRVVVCSFLPALINGGAINSEASIASYVGLCLGDPIAWLASVAALTYPILKYIVFVKTSKNTDNNDNPPEINGENAEIPPEKLCGNIESETL